MVAVISAWKTRDDKLDTAEGYFLAGRGLPGIVIAGSLLLTNLSAEQLVGTNGQTWSVGMSPMAFEIVAAPCCIVLALFAAPRYLKSGITTIPELIGLRYDRSTKLWFSIAYILLYIVVQIPVILYSGSLVFENIFNVSGILGVTKFQAVIILCIIISVIGSIYAIFGGLKAVAVSDTVNGIGLLIGGFMIPFFALSVLGKTAGGDGLSVIDGMRFLIENHADMLNSIAPADSLPPAVPWPTVFTGLFFLGLQSWCTHQSFIQRVLAAKNLKEAQKGALYCAFLKIIGFMYLALPGVIAYALFELQGDQVSMMDEAYPQLVSQVVPAPLMGFFAAVMFGAILSSFNSVLNSASTIYALDIHRPLFNPTASDARMVKIGQNFGTVVAVVSTIMSPFMLYMGGITSFVNSAFAAFNTPIFVCLLCGFFWKKVPAIAAKIVIPVHVVLYFILQFGLRNVIPALNSIHYLYFTAILFVFDMLLMWVIVKKHPRATDFELKDVGAVDLTPWKNGKIWATVTLLIMVLAYIIFSPHWLRQEREDHLPELPRESDHCLGFRFRSVMQLKTTVVKTVAFFYACPLCKSCKTCYANTKARMPVQGGITMKEHYKGIGHIAIYTVDMDQSIAFTR